MIPGPYAVAHASFDSADSDCATYKTLRWGFDSASQARSALSGIAEAFGVAADDCVVIRTIEADEDEAFTV